MKHKKVVIGLSVIFLINIIFYLTLNNYILTIIFSLPLYFLLFYFILPLANKIEEKVIKLDELYTFINTTLAQLKVDKSLITTFKNVAPYWPKTIAESYNTFELETKEFISLCSSYFNIKYFEIFTNILAVHDSKGGDITDRSNSLINGIVFSRLMFSELIKTKNRKLTEFIIMWILTFLILIYMRIGLAPYYLALLSTNFIYSVILVISLFIVSTYFAINTYRKIEVNIL